MGQQGRMAVLLVQGNRIGEVQVEGVFESAFEAKEYADEELGRGVVHEVQIVRYY